MLRIVLGDSDPGEHDVDAVLPDLADADAEAETEAAEPGRTRAGTVQVNLAELHLARALELYRVGQPEEAEKHSMIAGSHGQYLDRWRFSVPFLAVALARSGRRDEALALVEQVIAELPADIEWYNVAALTHTTRSC